MDAAALTCVCAHAIIGGMSNLELHSTSTRTCKCLPGQLQILPCLRTRCANPSRVRIRVHQPGWQHTCATAACATCAYASRLSPRSSTAHRTMSPPRTREAAVARMDLARRTRHAREHTALARANRFYTCVPICRRACVEGARELLGRARAPGDPPWPRERGGAVWGRRAR
jgi:hypothetical protein